MAINLSDNNILVPALVGLAVVVATVLAFYIASRKKSTDTGGSHYVSNDKGATVRRSTRSRKSVSRWSPDDLASPTGMSSPVVKPSTPAAEKPTSPTEAKTPAALKSVRKAAQAVKTPVVKAVDGVVKEAEALVSPSPVKRGPGRPPKTPKVEAPTSPRGPVSPPTTRRAAKTPSAKK